VPPSSGKDEGAHPKGARPRSIHAPSSLGCSGEEEAVFRAGWEPPLGRDPEATDGMSVSAGSSPGGTLGRTPRRG
jgi:hypothetical protein